MSLNKIIAEFSIQYRSLLNENGQLNDDAPAFAKNKDEVLYLYEQMLKLRTFDTKAINLQRTGKMGTYASTLGQEAISVAMGRAMHKEDVLVPYYRDYGAQFQRGVSMLDILRYWGGDERGSDYKDPAAAEDFPISVPIASQCLHATGVAKAFVYRKQARVAVTTVGEGGTSEGDFYEAINLAGAWHLPVVFVVNNNQWAISVPRNSQTGCKTIAQKAIAGGFEGIQVDGNDVLAVKQTIEQALEKARNGGGPTLIEAITYRLCDHTTADDAGRYRPKQELDDAWQKEPIKRLKAYIIAQGWWDENQDAKLQEKLAELVNKAVEEYVNTPLQSIDSIFDYMYATLPQNLQEQKQYAKKYAGKNNHD